MSFSGYYMPTVFKKHLLEGVHNFREDGHTFKIALYTNAASLSANTEQYTAEGEITGTGYTAGGLILVNLGPVMSGTAAFADFADATWPSATFSARGALVYNSTPSQAYVNPAVMVIDFGQERSVTNQDFTLIFPPADRDSAIIRIY